MCKIVLASNNKHKINEVKEILNNIEILTLEDINFYEEIEETGNTFLENALIKAKTVSKFLKSRGLDYDVLADDSGLCCLEINLEPGIYSARYSGGYGNSKENRYKLINNLKGKNKEAYFNCTLVLYHIDGRYIYREGKIFGEATDKEKNSVSHMYRALIELKKEIKN